MFNTDHSTSCTWLFYGKLFFIKKVLNFLKGIFWYVIVTEMLHGHSSQSCLVVEYYTFIAIKMEHLYVPENTVSRKDNPQFHMCSFSNLKFISTVLIIVTYLKAARSCFPSGNQQLFEVSSWTQSERLAKWYSFSEHIIHTKHQPEHFVV